MAGSLAATRCGNPPLSPHRFPYGIIYAVENGEVLVISVMHLHRHPDSWRKNLP